MDNLQAEQLKTLLKSTKNVVIIPHKNPDGDAMGSTLGLCHYLKNKGHDCCVISPNNYPDFLKWLPGNEQVRQFCSEREICEKHIDEADLIFTLDFNTLSRTGEMAPVLEQQKGRTVFIMIDHHQQPDDYAAFTYSDPTASSTCELVYRFIRKTGDSADINATIATCLYTGIMTDTGSFKFSSTTGDTHRVVADLIDKGAQNTVIHQRVYDTKSYDQLQLLSTALRNLKVFEKYRTAYISLSQEELDKHHFKKGDTEGMVNYGLSLKGIVLAAIFIEHKEEGIIKISLRSKGNFDVNKLARKYFNGGGHINAAGGKSLNSLKETTAFFEHILKDIQID